MLRRACVAVFVVPACSSIGVATGTFKAFPNIDRESWSLTGHWGFRVFSLIG